MASITVTVNPTFAHKNIPKKASRLTRTSFIRRLLISISKPKHVPRVVCTTQDGSQATTYMVKLDMKAVDGRSTSKVASVACGSRLNTVLMTVVRAYLDTTVLFT